MARRRPYEPPRDRGKLRETKDVLSMIRRMVRAAGRRVGEADPDLLRELVAIRDNDLERAIRAAIEAFRDAGYSWKAIGEEFDPPISGQAVYMRYGKPAAKAG